MIRIKKLSTLTVLLVIGLSGVACTQSTSLEAVRGGEGSGALQRPAGYLVGRVPAVQDFLPPPPAAGSAEEQAELQIFRDTRSLSGTRRWQMATQDAAFNMWSTFACALGAQVNPDEVPLTSRFIRRVSADVFPIINQQKDFYKRPRPYAVVEGETCVPMENTSANTSYPSGHSTGGWTWALLLAELLPVRAGQIIGRGRAFGESRVICGVHYPSDVVAGQTIATAVIAAMQSDPEFMADRDAAKAELDAVRSAATEPDEASCAAESELIRQHPW